MTVESPEEWNRNGTDESPSPVLELVRQWQSIGRPRPLDGRQKALSDRLVMPIVPNLADTLLQVRLTVDRDVAHGRLRFARRAHPYPKGYCQEITRTVASRLPAWLDNHDDVVAANLLAFQTAGGVFTEIWGDLRSQYFQNAIQIGTLYVDVANDTVDTTKPKIEILPLAESGFQSVTTFEHFLLVARRYWGGQFYANTVFPHLAPVLPIIHVAPSRKIALKSGLAPIFGENLINGCGPALAYLMGDQARHNAPPLEIADACRERMGTTGWCSDACREPDWDRLQHSFAHADATPGRYWSPNAFADLIQTVERVTKFR